MAKTHRNQEELLREVADRRDALIADNKLLQAENEQLRARVAEMEAKTDEQRRALHDLNKAYDASTVRMREICDRNIELEAKLQPAMVTCPACAESYELSLPRDLTQLQPADAAALRDLAQHLRRRSDRSLIRWMRCEQATASDSDKVDATAIVTALDKLTAK